MVLNRGNLKFCVRSAPLRGHMNDYDFDLRGTERQEQNKAEVKTKTQRENRFVGTTNGEDGGKHTTGY